MLLRSIVLELDRHLDRLLALRKIIASLEKTPVAPCKVPITFHSLLTAEAAPHQVAKRFIKLRKPKSLHKAPAPKNKVVPEIAPLVMSRSIPAGPVVVSRRQLEEERQRRLTPQTQTVPAVADALAETVDLDQLSRTLSARWFMGSVQ